MTNTSEKYERTQQGNMLHSSDDDNCGGKNADNDKFGGFNQKSSYPRPFKNNNIIFGKHIVLSIGHHHSLVTENILPFIN